MITKRIRLAVENDRFGGEPERRPKHRQEGQENKPYSSDGIFGAHNNDSALLLLRLNDDKVTTMFQLRMSRTGSKVKGNFNPGWAIQPSLRGPLCTRRINGLMRYSLRRTAHLRKQVAEKVAMAIHKLMDLGTLEKVLNKRRGGFRHKNLRIIECRTIHPGGCFKENSQLQNRQFFECRRLQALEKVFSKLSNRK